MSSTNLQNSNYNNNIYHGLNDVPVDPPGALVGLDRDGVVVDKPSTKASQTVKK